MLPTRVLDEPVSPTTIQPKTFTYVSVSMDRQVWVGPWFGPLDCELKKVLEGIGGDAAVSAEPLSYGSADKHRCRACTDQTLLGSKYPYCNAVI